MVNSEESPKVETAAQQAETRLYFATMMELLKTRLYMCGL